MAKTLTTEENLGSLRHADIVQRISSRLWSNKLPRVSQCTSNEDVWTHVISTDEILEFLCVDT